VVSRYMRDRQLQRLAMVQMKRHRLAMARYVNETVIVVYALGQLLLAVSGSSSLVLKWRSLQNLVKF
jgi:hypothetical protein